jgi:hypothetical protein
MRDDARVRPRDEALSSRPSVGGRQLPPAGPPAQGAGRPGHPMRAQSTLAWVAVALLGGGLTLPGCQEMGDQSGSASSRPAAVAEAPADAGYPALQSVPPRPQLSYTIQQERQIVEALIADRENARYTSQLVRYRTGISSLPPPPAPPAPASPAAAAALTAEPEGAAPEENAPERRLSEHETLADFLRALLSDDPAPNSITAEPAPERAALHEEPGAAAQPLATDGASEGPSAGPTGEAPVPPARSAVAARLAAGPGLIDALVDATVPQAPLPPGQSALAARLEAAARTAAAEPPAVPLPALRPAAVRSAQAALPVSPPAPPPSKPIVPVSAPMPPRPAEKPADGRSAAAYGGQELLRASPDAGAAAALVVAHAAP